jgi:hypothetical protein
VDPRIVGGSIAAALFGIYADLAYNCYSATNSSPQTTELFAGEREKTLMKYVLIGDAQVVALSAFGFIVLTAAGQRGIRWWPVIGGLTVGGIMHAMYAHALKAGKGSTPPTG